MTTEYISRYTSADKPPGRGFTNPPEPEPDPPEPDPTEIGAVTVNPDAVGVPVMGSKTFTAVITGGDATDLTYEWTVRSGNAQIDSPDNQSSATYTFIAAGQTQIQCNVYSDNATNSPQSNTSFVIVN